MAPVRPSTVFPLLLALLTGCGVSSSSSAPATHELRLSVATPTAAPPSEVTRVTVTVSAPDMSPRSTNLALSNGAWGGVLGDLPAGAHRTVLAQAFNASDTLRYQGSATDVTLTAGATGLVSLSLQELSVPAPTSNEAPILDSLVANPLTLTPGGSMTLTASAHDPNAGDSVSFTWSAPTGSFSTPTQASTTWTAPMGVGIVSLKLTVSDTHGASSAVTLWVGLTASRGADEVKVVFNTAPQVMSLVTSQALLDVGQSTQLRAQASDAEGDSLSYQWSATCAGSFSDPSSADVTFTPSARPEGACNNCQVRVSVTDGRGGQTQGSLALCVSAPPKVHDDVGWSTTARMLIDRSEHQLITLSTGKVLAVGGDLQQAELYDPDTGTWSFTGSLSLPRDWNTATLLTDGRVLVSGGASDDSFLGSAELYDPATGTWSPTGSMAQGRSQHTATRLPDGKVLVAGGSKQSAWSCVYGSGNAVATAELYDPATGTWSPTGSMTTPRCSHMATALLDGRVLVVGGKSDDGWLATAELYDPATGTWSATDTLSSPHFWGTATLLPSGKVLVAGDTLTAELYDPITGTWSLTGPMSSSRLLHVALLLPTGQVLVTGGLASWAVETTELYDPSTDTWSPAGSMSRGRLLHAAALLPTGQVLLSGGYTDSYGSDLSDLYSP